MTWLPTEDPVCDAHPEGAPIELVIEGRARDVAGLPVRRVLPSARRRLVGPFVFLDHMGPVDFEEGRGLDVPPHPHIGLATVTYLFEGEILHRDSLGSEQIIEPFAVNWMTAGRGIVHSERTSPERRRAPHRLDGIQLWVALPREHEETEPRFVHHAASDFPARAEGGAELRVLAGSAFGVRSPVETFSPLFYVDVSLSPGARLPLPNEHSERAAYVAKGSVRCGAESFDEGTLVVFRSGREAELASDENARVMLLGGEPVGPRFIRWNFVASSEETLDRAEREWRAGGFPLVPGDEEERVPFPSR